MFPGFVQSKPSRLWTCSIFSGTHYSGSSCPGGSTWHLAGIQFPRKRTLWHLRPLWGTQAMPMGHGIFERPVLRQQWWPGRYCGAPQIQGKGLSEWANLSPPCFYSQQQEKAPYNMINFLLQSIFKTNQRFDTLKVLISPFRLRGAQGTKPGVHVVNV